MNLSQMEYSFDDDREEDKEDLMRERNDLHKAENMYTSSAKISKDDFMIVKVIGRGGFGKVYMVKKRTNGKVFAMKVLSKD